MTRPPCTVALPVYNRPEWTLRAVRSALAQDVDGLEVIAVDDCSTDGTWEHLQAVADPRLRVVRNPRNLGLFPNFNRCVELATGTYLRILCCDDALPPGCLRAELALATAHPTAAVVTTRGRLVTAAGEPAGLLADWLPTGRYPSERAAALAVWALTHYGYNPFNFPSGVLLLRSAVVAAGRFPTTLRVAGDVALFLAALRHGDLVVAEHVGCEVTAHAGQVSTLLEAQAASLRDLLGIVRDEFPGTEAIGGRRLLRQLAGLVLYMQARYWLTGNAAAVRAHAQLLHDTGCSTVAAVAAGVETAWYRTAARRFGRKAFPPTLLKGRTPL